MAAVREERKATIRALVRSHEVHTQQELVALLKERGTEVTQATVSRDVAELGLEKSGQVYVLPEDLRLREVARAQVREVRRAGNQVIIITEAGAAQGMAAALDAAQEHGVLGTIAGDDTILVVTADDEAGQRFQRMVNRLVTR